jgi:dTDP-4-dehydrorhamnose reductase
MRVLVTGAYGQLGRELNDLSRSYNNCDFVFTDVDSLDITDENAVKAFFDGNKFDFVVNCAAYTAVDKAETDEINAEKVNAFAPKLLARYSKKIGAKLVHVSTDYVFDGTACEPYNENDLVDPQGAYGRTKLKGEQFVLSENSESVIIRTAWLYSAYGNNFVKTMLRLGNERSELNVVFDQVGSPTNAADLAAAILSIINSSQFVPGIYHFSNEGVASWYDFTKAIFDITGISCQVQPVLSDQFPTPTKRPHFSVLDKSKIKNTYDVAIPYWKDSLKICIDKLFLK